MKIASKIRPRDGKPRTHVVHGTHYVFAPTADRAGEVHFVADVTNADHGALFMGNGNFYHFGEDLQAAPLTRTAPPAPAAQPGPPPSNGTETLVTQFGQAAVDEATALVAGSMTTIGTAVSTVSGPSVVIAALAIEKGKESPRKSVVELLERTIEGLRAAGLLDKQP